MSDEIENEIEAPIEEPVVAEIKEEITAEVVDNPDYSPEEIAKAKADGWREDDEKGLSPGEFNRNRPFIEKMVQKSKTIENLRHQLTQIKRGVDEARRQGYEEGLRALDAQRKEAVKYGNIDDFERIDNEMQRVKEDYQNASKSDDNTNHPDVVAFLERNSWAREYTPDTAVIQDAANTFEQRLDASRLQKGLPVLSYAEKAEQIEQYVHKRFPEQFNRVPTVSKNATVAPAVAASGSPSIKEAPTKASINDLTDFQKERFTFLKQADPSITVDKYVEMINSYLNPKRK